MPEEYFVDIQVLSERFVQSHRLPKSVGGKDAGGTAEEAGANVAELLRQKADSKQVWVRSTIDKFINFVGARVLTTLEMENLLKILGENDCGCEIVVE